MASAEHSERYVQRFPGGFELNEYDRPFDICFLLSAFDCQGHRFSYDKVLGAADYAVEYITPVECPPVALSQSLSGLGSYWTWLSENAEYPANHFYLSIGASRLQIPRKEILALVAARVFRNLKSGVFSNRPTKMQINLLMARELELSEPGIRSALYRNVPHRPELNTGTFRYADIWPSNQPYKLADQWLDAFRQRILQNAADIKDNLDRRLECFIQRHLEDSGTGPIYLAHALKPGQTVRKLAD